jgi:Zn-dependent protease with chaperone function
LLVFVVMAMGADASATPGPVPIPRPSPEAIRFHTTGNAWWIFDQVWGLAIPALVLATGLSVALRDRSRRLARGWFGPTVLVYAALYLAIVALIGLPLDYIQGFARLHEYGLSNQTVGRWFGHWVIGQGVNLILSMLAAAGVYLLIRRFPRGWWVAAGLTAVPLGLLGAYASPLVVDPLFNEFREVPDASLVARIRDLAARAGVPDVDVYQVDKSRDTKAVNAYVTGLGRSHRVVLWDTMRDRLGPDESLAIVAHELGHYVMGHVIQGVLVGAGLTLAGLGLASIAYRRLIARIGPRWHLEGPADPAAAPVLLIVVQLVALVLVPVGNAFSRHMERSADRFAIELTGSGRSVARAFAILQEENLSVPDPAPLYRVVRATHPSLGERIRAGNAAEGPGP